MDELQGRLVRVGLDVLADYGFALAGGYALQAHHLVDRMSEDVDVGMTRGRHHNLACVIIEPTGDEHQHRQPPTPSEILTAALRRTSSEKSATETLREELDNLGKAPPQQTTTAVIIESLRQTQRHSYPETLRRHTQRQMHAFPTKSPATTVSIDGPDL